MAIRSPYNSFVDFNTEITDCQGNTRQAKLPVIDHYGIKFQIKVEDELKLLSEVLYAGVLSDNCTLEYDPNYEVIQTCNRYKFMGTGSVPITEDMFPILVGNYAPNYGQPQIPAGTYNLSAFLQAVSDAYEVQIDSLDFYDCCELPTMNGIVVFYNGTGLAQEISLEQFWGYGYVDFPETEITEFVAGECFRYGILDESKAVVGCSNLFYVSTDTCYTSVLTYHNEENGYGFRYVIYDDDGVEKITKNQIRLPFYLRRPQFTVTENIFRRSDGVKQRTSTLIEKDWLGTVGYLSADQHEKLLIALKHDVTVVQNDFSGINARMTQEGEYTPGYPDELNVALVPAEFRISDYSHNYVNNNCGFNCGIEFVEDCDGSGGGGTTPCPDKYSIEFTVGGAEMADGDTVYQNNNLKNKIGVEVYREGLLQHSSGVNKVEYTAATGQITFTPAVYSGERIAIIEV
jgi:hypothetical protein